MKKWLKQLNINVLTDILEKNRGKNYFQEIPYNLDKKLIKDIYNRSEKNEQIQSENKFSFFSLKSGYIYASLFIIILTGFIIYFISNSQYNIFNHNYAVATNIDGEPLVQYLNKNKWILLKNGDKLYKNNKIKTIKKSKVKIDFKNNTYIELNENSDLKISKINYSKDKNNIYLNLIDGTLFSQVNPVDSNFQVETNLLLLKVKGTQFSIQHDKESNITNLNVNNGKVSISKKLVINNKIENIKKISDQIAKDIIELSQIEVNINANEKITITSNNIEETQKNLDDLITNIEKELNKDPENQIKIDNIIKTIKEQKNIIKKDLQQKIINTSKDKQGQTQLDKKDKTEILKEKDKKIKPYINDFEDLSLKNIFQIKKWKIVKDEKGNNAIMPDFQKDVGHLYLDYTPDKSFEIQFCFQKLITNPQIIDFNMVIDLGIGNFKEREINKNSDIIIFNKDLITFKNRKNEIYTEVTKKLEYKKWYHFRLQVLNRKDFILWIDNEQIFKYTKQEEQSYTYFKFEAHPVRSKYLIDDIIIKPIN